MKQVFCAYQEKITSRDDDRIKLNCTLFNKECPYNKLSKAIKKCQQCYIINENEEYND
mgnify:FL=1